MKNSAEMYRKIMNYNYLSMCRTVDRLPFSGRYWLEQMIMGSAEYFLAYNGAGLNLKSQNPGDICRGFLGLLDDKGSIDTGVHRIREDGDNVLVTVDRQRCIYREYCLQAKSEGFSFYCVRMGVFRYVIKKIIDRDYSASVEVDEEKKLCQGKLFPVHETRQEIVTREGDTLNFAGMRAILMPQEQYVSLLISIKEHAPHVLKHVLYDAGYRASYHVAQKVKVMNPCLEDRIRQLTDEIKNTGWGKVELVSLDRPSARATFRCYDSFQVSSVQNYGPLYRTPQVVCDLLRGIIAAFLTVFFEREIICEEMNCQAVNGDFCEFIALPISQKNGREEGVTWVKG